MEFLLGEKKYPLVGSILDTVSVEATKFNIKALAKSREDEGVTTRSYFDTERMLDEIEIAKKNNLSYQETIAGAKGCWSEEVAIDATDEAVVQEALTFGFYKSQLETTSSLLELYADYNDETDYSFRDRNSEKNIIKFRNLVASHRTRDGGAYKDWDQVINFGDGKTKAKFESRGEQKMFDTQVVEYGEDVDRQLEKMVDNKNVAKAILFKNKDGKVDRVEFWFGHVFCDEPEGTRIVKNVFDARLVEENPNSEKLIKVDPHRNLLGTKIIRKVESANGGSDILRFDVHSSYKEGEFEKSFNHGASSLIKMNAPVYDSLSYMLLDSEQKSGYVCVGAVESSALQFTLMTKPDILNDLFKYFKRNSLYDHPKDIGALINTPDLARILKTLATEMKDMGAYQADEIKYARNGLSLVNFLGTYIPEASKKLFEFAFKERNGIVTGGSYQVSKVDHKDKDGIPNMVFTTASNATTKEVRAIKSGKESTIVDTRIQTDERMYDEVRIRLSEDKVSLQEPKNVEPIIKSLVEEKIARGRMSKILLSYILRANHILSNSSFVTRKDDEAKLADLNHDFSNVLNELAGSRIS